MQSTNLCLQNQLGLHARASSKLVKTAARFVSNIHIQYDNKGADAKSIMDVMMLGAACGSELKIEAEGEDEQQAIQALTDLIEAKFGEEA